MHTLFSFSAYRNYSSELSAFQARLGEKFDEGKLRQAFISPEYVEAELKRQQELGITASEDVENAEVERQEHPSADEPQLPVVGFESNSSLAEVGREITEATVKAYLRSALAYLPEEAVEAVAAYLMGDKLLAHISFHIGTMDLILSEVMPTA